MPAAHASVLRCAGILHTKRITRPAVVRARPAMSERASPDDPTRRPERALAEEHRSLGSPSAGVARRWLILVPVLCLAGWFWLAMQPLFLGPADWDDTMYADRAISGAFVWDARNRYVHVWAIRM